MAPQKTVELFRGNCVSEKAHTWLRTLEGTWRFDTKEEEKLYQFEKGLHLSGQADEWWNELKAAIIEELKSNTLDFHALGTYVKDEDGTSVLTHVAWAGYTQASDGATERRRWPFLRVREETDHSRPLPSLAALGGSPEPGPLRSAH
ncbi:hypothetical protein B0H14DRAFT_3494048 [Mycena olivaceomarginata]|nr:hypothetical protein B0H14DRAFT_3494048 [Mycena olivaceomarginata]